MSFRSQNEGLGKSAEGRAIAAAAGALCAIVLFSLLLGSSSADVVSHPPSIAALEASVLEGGGLAPRQAWREVRAQSAVDAAHLPERLAVAMGPDYSGVWFAPAEGRLRVGVTSARARRVAQSLTEQSGLEPYVAVVPVRSTWGQLVATQKAWGERLAGLFSREQVLTALKPQLNAVEIRLASSVPAAKRVELERRASAEEVKVRIVSTNLERITGEPEGRCKTFAEDKAFCNGPIVAGVSIESQAEESTICTAGPAVIKKNPATDTTETFILTAGHCIHRGGGKGATWSSWDKGETKRELGKAVEYMSAPTGDKVDVGVIKVEKEPWKNGTQTPVAPSLVRWAGAEPEPINVTGKNAPAANKLTCHSGQTSGLGCGKISAVEVKYEEFESPLENLVEVKEMTVESKKGDSGGPWFSNEAGTLNLMEGIHWGKIAETKFSLFYPLDYVLKRLEEIKEEEENKPISLELLTTANQTRPKCPMPTMSCFKGESYPVILSGSQIGEDVFTFNAGTVKCKSVTYTGFLPAESASLELTPSYGECTAFGFLGTMIDVNGCKYRFNSESVLAEDKASGSVDVVCPGGNKIVITAPNCEVSVGNQNGLKTVNYTDTTTALPKKDIDISVNTPALIYTQISKGFPGCTNASFINGKWVGETTVKGTTGGGAADGIELG